MLNKITQPIDFQAKALSLRAERQRTIASNIANADTPGYVARDFKFADAMRDVNAMSDLTLKMSPSGDAAASAGSAAAAAGMSQPGHIPLPVLSTTSLQQGYAVASQPAMDNNTVDLDRERANFVDNSVRYEATLRFINGYTKTILSAIQGQ
ncbi:flagellar basal body rod protein FlgB [Curvibacter gracilis]|jgi:flagellar basal-body rod protein FlgB|uniref:flagellar basal body rod protein FlgB n=1 Tax=Curvibacter gracilis TaxID=230310 RepID=UPI000485AFBB|nr:flagellar basal body rod protein FlgB [Curvibacter gracilis]